MSFAIQCSRILKLQILLGSNLKSDPSTISVGDVRKLKSQLRSLRDEVNKMLDTLDGNAGDNLNKTETKGILFHII